MKAWVFNEEQLHDELENWLATHMQEPATSISRSVIEDFLYSHEAHKLRVKQLEQSDAPAATQR